MTTFRLTTAALCTVLIGCSQATSAGGLNQTHRTGASPVVRPLVTSTSSPMVRPARTAAGSGSLRATRRNAGRPPTLAEAREACSYVSPTGVTNFDMMANLAETQVRGFRSVPSARLTAIDRQCLQEAIPTWQGWVIEFYQRFASEEDRETSERNLNSFDAACAEGETDSLSNDEMRSQALRVVRLYRVIKRTIPDWEPSSELAECYPAALRAIRGLDAGEIFEHPSATGEETQ